MSNKDTGWRGIKPVSGDGTTHAGGIVEPITGKEQKPCCMCRSWEKDEKKLIQHLMSLGLEANPDKSFTTPIAKDLPGRVSLKIYPARSGFCRLESTVTEDLASCEKWELVRFISELASRL
jgi:hypothetical protein